MIEKRFTIENDVEMKDNWNINKRCYHFGNGFDAKDCCNMLNELQEENMILKSELSFSQNQNRELRKVLEDNRSMMEVIEENKQLKHDATILIYSNQEYRKENEQLKQPIKEVLKLLEGEVDLFSDKATEHDIQAYIELGELDNKDAYYMAVSTKKAIKILKEMIE